MSNYNKNERTPVTKLEEGNRSVVKCHWTSYFGPIVHAFCILYLFSMVAFDLNDYIRARIYGYDYPGTEKLAIMSILVGIFCIPWIYVLIRGIFVDVKGKLEYTDTTLHYEGYDFGLWPRKTIADLDFSEMAYVHIRSERAGKVDRKIMGIRKSDGTKMDLNICYFDIDEITKLVYQGLVRSGQGCSGKDAQNYRITIHNHKEFFLGYLHLHIFINEDSEITRDSTCTVDVKTGDILGISAKSHTHLFRMEDPSLTQYRVDNSMNTFKILIGKE